MEDREKLDIFTLAVAGMDSGEQRRILDLLLENMDVPEMRRNDLGWLTRNLAIRNSEHPGFELASDIVRRLSRSGN